MGEILSLMIVSEFHQPYLINDFGTAILVPIHLNQFRVYKKKSNTDRLCKLGVFF